MSETSDGSAMPEMIELTVQPGGETARAWVTWTVEGRVTITLYTKFHAVIHTLSPEEAQRFGRLLHSAAAVASTRPPLMKDA